MVWIFQLARIDFIPHLHRPTLDALDCHIRYFFIVLYWGGGGRVLSARVENYHFLDKYDGGST